MAKQTAKRSGNTRKQGAKPPVAPPAKVPAAKLAKDVAEPEKTPVAPPKSIPEPEFKTETAVADPAPVAEPAPAITQTVTKDEADETPSPVMDIKGSVSMEDTMTNMKAQTETLITKAKDYASEFGAKAKGAATEMGSFTKGNFEAVVESGKIASEGTSTIAKDNMAFTKKSIEDFASTAKEMSALKSPSEFVKTQGDFIRKSFDENMAQMTKSTEAFMKLMGDAYQPISNRVSLASEKMKTVA